MRNFTIPDRIDIDQAIGLTSMHNFKKKTYKCLCLSFFLNFCYLRSGTTVKLCFTFLNKKL